MHSQSAVRHVPGMRLVEHRFAVPLRPDATEPTIEVFAREVRAAAHADEDRPYLLMINGGPGQRAQRPARKGAWLARALQDFHVVLLDQRGTGLSTPLTAQTLAPLGDAAAIADHASHFRADAIVRDAEHVRRALLGDRPWTILGQSFGGFTALTYLSFAPEGVAAALITGGLPSLHRPALDVYRALNVRLDRMLDRYLTRYPDDRERWEAVLAHVGEVEERTARGRVLTPESVRLVGIDLGMSTGPEQLHYLVESAFAAPDALSTRFLEELDSRTSFALQPVYAILHEPAYAQGEATRWSAQRALDERPDGPPLLFGETIHPFMFEQDPALVPLRDAAELLAAKDDWNPLYDREILAANEVPTVAAVYLDDLYVESRFSLETADAVGSLRAWVTNEHDHDGLHVGGVLDRLLLMLDGEA